MIHTTKATISSSYGKLLLIVGADYPVVTSQCRPPTVALCYRDKGQLTISR